MPNMKEFIFLSVVRQCKFKRHNIYRRTVHFEFYAVYTLRIALFINLVKSFKLTLKYTTISLLYVSVFNDHHQGALSVPN